MTTIQLHEEPIVVRTIDENTVVIRVPGPRGPRGDRGVSDSLDGAVIDLTNFEYLGVQYGMVAGVMADQTVALLAGFAAAAAGPIKVLYLPTGVYWLGWLLKSLNTRILPEGCHLRGDGEGKTIIRALEGTFLANVPELQTGTVLHYDSSTRIYGITVDGRGDQIRALPGTTNRRNNLIEQKYIALTSDPGVENVWVHDVEVTGQYSNEVAGAVVSSNTVGAYQFTLAAGHNVEANDKIWVRNHAGATFSRTVDGVTLTWTGNGVYTVLSVDGNNIEVQLEATGDAVTVTVAGTGGTVDNTTKNALEGFGLVCGHGRNIRFSRIHAHHNEGTGATLNWRDRANTAWGHTGIMEDIHSHHNGWQGLSSFGFNDITIDRPVTYNNDRVGVNTEYADNVVVNDGISYNNGIHDYRDLGDGSGITYKNCVGRYGGAKGYVANYGPLAGSYPNDPTVTFGARTDGTNWNISTAPWQRLGMNRVGAPARVILDHCTAIAAPGKYHIRSKVHATANMDNGSQPEVIFYGPQVFTWQPVTGTGAEPDANESVNLQAQTKHPQLATVQRIPVPALPFWTMQNGAALTTPTGAWTTGLTSTAGAVTTINWTAHGLQTGMRALLDAFATVGEAQINRATPHVITRTGANTFTIDVPSTSNGVGGRGIDYRAELAGCTSSMARVIEMSATAGSGYRWPLPLTQAIGHWRPRYKLMLSDDWWTSGITTDAGNPTNVNWTAHPFETGDRVIFEDMAGSDDIAVNDHHGFLVTVVDADNFTIPITTTQASSGGRAARMADIPVVDIGVKNASGVLDAANGRFYPSVYQQITVGDNYLFCQPDIDSAPRAAVPGIYQLAMMLRKSNGSIAGHRIVVDYVGGWHSHVQTPSSTFESAAVESGTIAYPGDVALAANAVGTATTVTGLTDVIPGDYVKVTCSSLTDIYGQTIIVSSVHASGQLRFRVKNVGTSALASPIPAGTYRWEVQRAPR